jgi:hypothetical protein
MSSTGNAIVDRMASVQISGNVIPQSWYKTITKDTGKPYLAAIVILSDIVYWYRPVEVRDEDSGRTVSMRKKFKSDLLQRSYAQLAEQFGISKRDATNAVVALEKLGVIKRHFRKIEVGGMLMNNVLFIELVPDVLESITFGTEESNGFGDTYHSNKGQGSLKLETGPTQKSETNTKTTKETTTKTSKKRVKAKAFVPPTIEEVESYIKEKGYTNVSAAKWISRYKANGWMVGRTKMKDWRACVDYWHNNDFRKDYSVSNNNVAQHTKEENELSFASPITFD